VSAISATTRNSRRWLVIWCVVAAIVLLIALYTLYNVGGTTDGTGL
jgi:hypothetical protein